MSDRFDPNFTDIETEKCPLCDKDIVFGAWHRCPEIVGGTEYVSETLGIRLLWTRDNGWRSYYLAGGDVIEDLDFVDVANWVNCEDALFELVEEDK